MCYVWTNYSKYEVNPKSKRTFEIARQRAGLARSRLWRCVAWTLSFILTLATISHRATRAWMNVCLLPSVTFCKLKNKGSWKTTCLREILFEIGKNIYGDVSDVAAGLWGGLSEPCARAQVVTAFRKGQNVYRRRSLIWRAFHVHARRSRWKSACCDSWESSPNCP